MADQFEYELIIYDETENFRQYNNELFNYPYEDRRKRVTSFNLDFINPYTGPIDYSYPFGHIEYRLSQVCLEANPWDDLSFFRSAIPKTLEFFTGTNQVTDKEKTAFRCGSASSTPFEKLVFSDLKDGTKRYLDEYETGVITDRILLELQIAMAAEKLYSERSSSTILDLLGDIGGFNDFMDLIVVWFATFFSSKLFLRDIIHQFFSKKRPQTNTQ